MLAIDRLLGEALDAARSSAWSRYRPCFEALRAALETLPPDEEVRIHLDMLGAASPDHDPAGYLGELEELAGLLVQRGFASPTAAAPLPGRRRRSPRGAKDLRNLPPPGPMQFILEAVHAGPRRPLRVILPHEPLPLYRLLAERGLRWSGHTRSDGGFELLIERAPPDEAPEIRKR